MNLNELEKISQQLTELLHIKSEMDSLCGCINIYTGTIDNDYNKLKAMDIVRRHTNFDDSE